jgi:thioredoxin 1
MEITGEELFKKIENGEKIIVDFWASWCGPCKLYKPIFEKIAETKEVQMYTMNVENNTDFAVKMGIRAVPTTKIFDKGGETFSKSGLIFEEELKSMVKNLING